MAAMQATEIRQQLSILQVEIQSMQPSPRPATQPNGTLTMNAQPMSYSGTIRGTLDLRSPLSEGLQSSPCQRPTNQLPSLGLMEGRTPANF